MRGKRTFFFGLVLAVLSSLMWLQEQVLDPRWLLPIGVAVVFLRSITTGPIWTRERKRYPTTRTPSGRRRNKKG